MPLTLGFDTATADTAVAVTDGSGALPLAETLLGPDPDGRPEHGRALLGAIEAAVDASGGWPRIERIAVGIGPGSFTGMRIGVATARALAQARELPLAGVLTTTALARGIAELPEACDRPVLALLDARRGEVFASLDLGDGAPEPRACPPGELASMFDPALLLGALAGGEGAVRFRSEIEAAGVDVLGDSSPAHRLSARHVCNFGAGVEPGPPDELTPYYLRQPDAERWLERDNRN